MHVIEGGRKDPPRKPAARGDGPALAVDLLDVIRDHAMAEIERELGHMTSVQYVNVMHILRVYGDDRVRLERAENYLWAD